MTETLNGLHSCKPGNDPKVGEVKTFTVAQMTGKSGKQYLKIKAESMERGGSPYRILSVEPTGYTDSYGNISFNLEIEPAQSMERPTYPPDPRYDTPEKATAQAPQAPPARQNGQQIAEVHAEHARRIFHVAWDKATEEMKGLMPEKDAQDMELAAWYDLKLRIAQFIAIQTDRKM